jgi:hypothetical protein
MANKRERTPEEELPDEEQQIVDLPAREALTIVDPGVFGGQIIYNPPPLGRTADPLPPTIAGADVAP